MRSTMLLLIASVFVLPGAANGQPQYFKGASPEARRANQHYKSGWEAMRRESWDEAVKEFQAALDSDPKFTLAYYSLGRVRWDARTSAGRSMPTSRAAICM